jgi:hypothetical protein
VFLNQRDALVSSKVAANDPDRATFATLTPTPRGAVFDDDAAHQRGMVVLDDAHSRSTRDLILVLCHELNHFRNRGTQEAIEADTSQDIAGVTGFSAAELAETRRQFVDEVVARHVEWWAAWTMRMHRLGGAVADVDPPEPAALFADCRDFAMNAAGRPPYDPFGYWDGLLARGDDGFERQVAGWMRLVAHQTFSGNPFRDMQAQAAFLAASALTSSNAAPDGLDGDI